MELIERITLDLVFVGTKKTNFRILKMLPINVKKIMEETGLSKMPVNNHINELEKHCLLERERGTGRINPTILAQILLGCVNEMEKKCVKPCVENLLNRIN